MTAAQGQLVPLKSLNALLGIATIPGSNSDDELVVLPFQAANTELGLLVDGLQETMSIQERDVAMSMQPAKFGVLFFRRAGQVKTMRPRS